INTSTFTAELATQQEEFGHGEFSKFNQALSLQEVDFYYGERQILDQIQLEVVKNETIAFVGESGSGKTTLVSMLAGLLAPDKGTFRIDQQSAADWDMRSYQRRIGFITQEPVIFNDTIYNNISFWAPRTPENLARFHRAVEQASLHVFLNDLPQGSETML